MNDKTKLLKKTVYDAIIYDKDNESTFENQLHAAFTNNINLPVNDTDTIKADTINKIITYYYCNNKDELKEYFDYFLMGIKKMVKKNDEEQQVTIRELTNIFECEVTEEKNKFIKLLENERNQFSNDNDKLNILNIFIEIIEEMDPKKLPRLYEFISGTTCCPNNVKIDFNVYHELFTASLCSNGLHFPNYNDFNSKKLLKDALMDSLAVELI